jgi:NAD-specific glutamate dehydrogenase
MVHRGQVLVNPSLSTILSHTSLHVFHRLILQKTSSHDKVASKDIQYLEIELDQSFLVKIKPQELNQVNIQLLFIHMLFLLDLA